MRCLAPFVSTVSLSVNSGFRRVPSLPTFTDQQKRVQFLSASFLRPLSFNFHMPFFSPASFFSNELCGIFQKTAEEIYARGVKNFGYIFLPSKFPKLSLKFSSSFGIPGHTVLQRHNYIFDFLFYFIFGTVLILFLTTRTMGVDLMLLSNEISFLELSSFLTVTQIT